MTGQELIDHFDLLMKEKLDTISKKNNDYAKDDDAFSNFKHCADIANCTVEQVFMVFMSVKMARLQELLKGKFAMCESLQDTLKDLSNYADLFSLYLSNMFAISVPVTVTSVPETVTESPDNSTYKPFSASE